MATKRPASLHQAVARRIREHREGFNIGPTQYRFSQEELAAAARRLGFAWHRSTVAMIESGQRHITAEELLALPIIFDDMARRHLGIPNKFGYSLAGFIRPGPVNTLALSEGVVFDDEAIVGWLGSEVPLPEGTSHASRKRSAGWVTGEAGEAEHKAAGSLGVEVQAVMEATRVLYGCTLTEERDRRLRESARGGTKSTSDEQEAIEIRRGLQARRGHVTRRLLQEIRVHLKEV